jgi:non-specific serine/threonine protein kinase
MERRLDITVMPDKAIVPEWTFQDDTLPDKTTQTQNDVFNRFLSDKDGWLFYLGFLDHDNDLSLSLNYFIDISSLLIRRLSRIPDLESLRQKARVPDLSFAECDEWIQNAPMMTGADYIDREFINTLWSRLNGAYAQIITGYDGSVADFFTTLNPSIHLAGRVYFHLVENKNGDLPFAFMATYSSGMGRNGKPKHLPLKHALTEFDDNRDALLALLSTVYTAAEKSVFVKEMMDTGELFHPLALDSAEAFCFLKEIPVYEDSGILCRIPDWWNAGSIRSSLSISIGDSAPPRVGLDAMIDFKACILLGDMEITEDEARRMLEESEGLAFIKNRWVQVDHEKLKQAIEMYSSVSDLVGSGLALRDALRFQLNPGKIGGMTIDGPIHSVTHGAWLESITDRLIKHDRLSPVTPGNGFRADLRTYQKIGLNWLHFLDSLNFGACLADDMGLGKTIQVLAFLNTLRHRTPKHPSLLIVPASLISNWLNEIERVCPDLNVAVVHPGFTANTFHGTPEDYLGADLVITTYTLIQKYDWLHEPAWTYVILDEAQAIKNPGTKQTRAVKKLKAGNRIVMTGTPVENRLTDVWSLFDFLNPGLLGSMAEFSRFSKSLAQHPEGYGRLRKLVSPYILRRLKTDESVISDLPDKVEMKSYASLTKKQIVLYEKAVRDLEHAVNSTEGLQRKGIVLSYLMKFKQLCNHPDQLAGSGDFKEEESGKFTRLREICDVIYEKRERVLVFTQFKEITEPLQAFLETIFHARGLVLHGSISVNKRKSIIETFQQDTYCPFMVLSLKAGGVGLNLTKANHVIHFDRWWNPAVENQATDRAFRIGQNKNVVVHKFITKGTIEEKIDAMLTDKQELSDRVIAQSGETMITELDNSELINLFRLSL